jgi:YaiO family outer membrane protein
MKLSHTLIKFQLFVCLLTVISTQTSIGQTKIDVDSLLQTVILDVQIKEYNRAIANAQKGIELSPNYLDFYQFLGRAYQLTGKPELARENYKHVIDRNPAYKDVFVYWFSLEMEQKNYEEAEKVATLAIEKYPEEDTFYLKKLAAIQMQGDEEVEFNYIQSLPENIRNSSSIQQQLSILELRSHNDRIGASYAITTFDRNGVGPWHLGSIQYIRQRFWGSLIGRISYADRTANGNSSREGTQYEIESYINTGEKSYSYFDVAYSDDEVFQKWRLAYSYFQNFNKGWETELGIRYSKNVNSDNFTGVLGIVKYIGPYWINLRHFMVTDSGQYFPSFTLAARLYTGTRFDYFSASTGFGSSPEDFIIGGQFNQRARLDSYRFGAGYNKLIKNKFILGLGINYNNQEFAPSRHQNEWTFSTSLQYKF